ncbi:LPXTG cell wall anchor domain-containing protein [Streptomyces sp. NPDC051677]|uniref:LPXTG cell wall anchor domain-containing protein n=1 Tax=Streptomyces sp. NPDC051677 TaxID=3365669 RepID=UPI0037D07B25
MGSSALTDTSDTSDAAAQGGGKELAETGAGQTMFLIIGAATMIAGGIGFRVLPRLVEGRGGAAA